MTVSNDIVVSRETRRCLNGFETILRQEATRQNLISASSAGALRARHINDSLQLVPLLKEGRLVDIGSGAGLPGLVLAIAIEDPVHLVEPRKKRAEFLQTSSDMLGLSNVTVHATKAERVRLGDVRTITARAVASLDKLFTIARHLSDEDTRWVLPKGRSAAIELAEAERTWQGRFELVASRTDPDASIVIAERVRRR